MYHLLDSSDPPASLATAPLATASLTPFYDRLCDDTLGHVIGFLEEEEKVEWCHVHPRMRQLIVDYHPNLMVSICVRCEHHIKRCQCPPPRQQRRWRDCVVPIVVVGLFLIVVAAMGMAMIGYREGW